MEEEGSSFLTSEGRKGPMGEAGRNRRSRSTLKDLSNNQNFLIKKGIPGHKRSLLYSIL